jgi:hypothetical protein
LSLPSYDDVLTAQQRQENAEALRVAHGSTPPPWFVLGLFIRAIRVIRGFRLDCPTNAYALPIPFYAILSISMRFYAISMRCYTLSMHFLYRFLPCLNLNTCRFPARYHDSSFWAREFWPKIKQRWDTYRTRVSSVALTNGNPNDYNGASLIDITNTFRQREPAHE